MEESLLCMTCGREGTLGHGQMIAFIHQRLSFNVSGNDALCEQCLKNRAIKNFEEFGGFIKIDKDSRIIDWQNFLRVTAPEFWHARLYLLENIGVLSRKPAGRFAIVPGFQNITSSNGQTFFFKIEEDVLSYAKAIGSEGLAQRYVLKIEDGQLI